MILLFPALTESKTNKPWTVVLSAIIQAGLLGILILIPLIYTEALPKAMLNDVPGPAAPASSAASSCCGSAADREAGAALAS